MPLVRIELHDGIAIVILDRPDKRSAMSFGMLRELHATGLQLRRDLDLSAVVSLFQKACLVWRSLPVR